ncbi:hypothetical protein PGO21_05905 [Klebsiella aerogenes]
MGLACGLNVYQYAPNPQGYIDPKGLTPKTLYHYTTEEGMNGIMKVGLFAPHQVIYMCVMVRGNILQILHQP